MNDSVLSRVKTPFVAVFAATLMVCIFAGVFFMQKPKLLPSVGSVSVFENKEAWTQIECRVDSAVHFELPDNVEWTTPITQVEQNGWLYDVFTPPRIYIHPETGVFEPTAYQFDQIQEPRFLSICSVQRNLFRFQLVGFIENSLTEPEKSILLIEDRLEDETLSVRFEKGESLVPGYELGSFAIKTNYTDSGAISRVGMLTVKIGTNGDLHSEVLLASSAPTYEEGYVLTLQYGDEIFELNPDELEYSAGACVIRWKQDASIFPDFVFELTENSDSETQTVLLRSNLTPP